MDDALTAFLGKGTVTKGPIPAYPRSVPWMDKQGKGVYELHVQKDGSVSEVRILKSSGDEIFDRTAVDMLRKMAASPWPATFGIAVGVHAHAYALLGRYSKKSLITRERRRCPFH
jgi:TonB family protein